jgi:hypothetical protein
LFPTFSVYPRTRRIRSGVGAVVKTQAVTPPRAKQSNVLGLTPKAEGWSSLPADGLLREIIARRRQGQARFGEEPTAELHWAASRIEFARICRDGSPVTTPRQVAIGPEKSAA